MISYVYEYGCIYDYMVIWVHEYVCYIYVIWWSQIDIYMCDMILCYMCVMIVYMQIWVCCMTGILYVVLNTTCSCIWCYVMWIFVLYYVVMCVYVDNYVDNSLIYVDNFLLHLQHFYELFENIVFSHIISCYLLFTLIISFFHHIAIISYIVYTI